jgi:hypothetical protein
MEIPGKVSVYCPLIEAKGTPATLVAVAREGYYHLEVAIKGRIFAMLVPIAGTGLIFAEPEPERMGDLEIER